MYRLTRSGSDFLASLVQVLRVGFTDDPDLWAGAGDRRPYGNFAVDGGSGVLWAFVMRDADQVTRFFSFDLPDPAAGEADDSVPGIPVVTLQREDIRSRFDGGYSRYLQGAAVLDGFLYSLEGFTDSAENPPAIRIFDTRTGSEAGLADLYGHGYPTEPELISVYRGNLYYSDSKGRAYLLKFN